MSYLALARQYRPDDFSHILAQNHITRTLANAITTGRISHAYLFCGPRGTGKTTTARVLAKALNCQKGPTPDPCGECVNCQEIKAGMSPDVFEIDAASNRGIDDIRELRENIRYAPVAGRYKIYIIDEVHRLTNEAFDALLKTLEEPPSHVIFIFATTEPQNLPATILSRTQRFDFKRVPVNALAEAVTNVAKKEGLEIEPRAAILIGRKADGSLRDALSLLDQLINFSEGKITTQTTTDVLGLVKTEFLFEIIGAAFKHDTHLVLEMFNVYFADGNDIDQLAEELLTFVSKLLMVKNSVTESALLEMDNSEIQRAEELVAEIDTSDLLRMMKIIGNYIADKKAGVDPIVAMEVALTSLAGLDKTVEISKILSGINNPGNPVKRGGNPGPSKGNPGNPGARKMTYNRPSYGGTASMPPPSPPQPNTAAEMVTPTGPHELSEIEKWWPNFLSFMKAKSMMLWSQLNQLVLESVEDGKVKLGYNDNNKHLKAFLAKDKKTISEHLSEFCGNETGVLFVKTSIENSSTSGGNGFTNGSAEEFLEKHPKLMEINKLVDGRIIGFKGSNQ